MHFVEQEYSELTSKLHFLEGKEQELEKQIANESSLRDVSPPQSGYSEEYPPSHSLTSGKIHCRPSRRE